MKWQYLLGFLFLTTCYACSSEKEAPKPPNIIYILADDLGYNELGCYGQRKIKTPHIDQLAAEGMRFTQHYSGSTVCAPSRCVLLTGQHTGNAYVRDNYELGGFLDEEEGGQLPLKPNTPNMALMLQEAGYATACIGKWGLGGPNTTGVPNKQGFDFFYGYLCQKQAHNYYPTHLWKNEEWDTLANTFFHPHQRFPVDLDSLDANNYTPYQSQEYAVDRMREEAESFIRNHADEAFFLYYPIPIPHLGLQIPTEELEQYAHFEDPPYLGKRGYVPTAQPRATYAAMISRLDAEVGHIMATLKELGLDENTLVIFSSDNGATIPGVGGVDIAFFESHGPLRGWKTNLFEGGIRVPMIARWPKQIAAGSSSEHLSAFWDVWPTIAELTQQELDAPTDGISFLPTLLGKDKQAKHDHLYWEFHARGSSQAVRMGKYKAIRQNLKKNPNAPIELYDLSIDIGEENDISVQYPTIVQQMDSIMQLRTISEIEGWNFVAEKK